MQWKPALNRIQPCWLYFTSGVECEDEAQEDLSVRCQISPGVMSKPPRLALGFFLHDERIYHIDSNPAAPHNNSVVPGRPYSGQRIEGDHEHIWTPEAGDGYIEPIFGDLSPEELWQRFCRAINLRSRDFRGPDEDAETGQMRML